MTPPDILCSLVLLCPDVGSYNMSFTSAVNTKKKPSVFIGILLAGLQRLPQTTPELNLLATKCLTAVSYVPSTLTAVSWWLMTSNLHLCSIFKKFFRLMLCATTLWLFSVNVPVPKFVSPGFPVQHTSNEGKYVDLFSWNKDAGDFEITSEMMFNSKKAL